MTTVFKDKNGIDIQVGDVVATERYSSKGQGSGIVVCILPGNGPHQIGVDFGKVYAATHSLGRRIPGNTGYYIPARKVTILTQKEILGDNDDDCV